MTLYIQLKGKSGKVGRGEATPLNGFSLESIEKVKQDIASGCPYQYPSTQWAYDLAKLDLESKEKSCRIRDLISENPLEELKVNELFYATDIKILEKVKGIKYIKVKVGHQNIKRDIEVVKALCQIAENPIRLDANRAWDFKTAKKFVQNIHLEKVDYLEEPLRNEKLLSDLFKQTSVPYAIDESLQQRKSFKNVLKDFYGVKALIVKPMLIGSLKKVIELSDLAKVHQISFVLTHACEGVFGRKALKEVALALHSNKVPAGLGREI